MLTFLKGGLLKKVFSSSSWLYPIMGFSNQIFSNLFFTYFDHKSHIYLLFVLLNLNYFNSFKWHQALLYYDFNTDDGIIHGFN